MSSAFVRTKCLSGSHTYEPVMGMPNEFVTYDIVSYMSSWHTWVRYIYQRRRRHSCALSVCLGRTRTSLYICNGYAWWVRDVCEFVSYMSSWQEWVRETYQRYRRHSHALSIYLGHTHASLWYPLYMQWVYTKNSWHMSSWHMRSWHISSAFTCIQYLSGSHTCESVMPIVYAMGIHNEFVTYEFVTYAFVTYMSSWHIWAKSSVFATPSRTLPSLYIYKVTYVQASIYTIGIHNESLTYEFVTYMNDVVGIHMKSWHMSSWHIWTRSRAFTGLKCWPGRTPTPTHRTYLDVYI